MAPRRKLLLAGLHAPAAYVPVDIAPEWLEAAASRVTAARPGLPVLPVVADFTQGFALPKRLGVAPRLGFFPGSTIGNFRAGRGHRLPASGACDARRGLADAAGCRLGEGGRRAGGGV
ncbi:L-histidine N(alpha)-methyltransferase [Dankookia sp. P2]|uniref:L-histidine N(alpha)-methyltransferase n=1 Tax=Dankookia sp. P2 TaxID=3423955 RepID=UPI003D66CE46